MRRSEGYRRPQPDWTPNPRQRAVLDLLLEGKTNPEIAEALGITLDGAKWHVGELLALTGLADRQALAAWWRESRDVQERGSVLAFAKRVAVVAALTLAGVALVLLIATAVVGSLDGHFRIGRNTPHSAGLSKPGPPAAIEPVLDTAPDWSRAHYVSRDGPVLTVGLDAGSELVRIDLSHLGVFDCRIDCCYSDGTLGALSNTDELCIGWLGTRQGHQDGMLWVDRYTCYEGGRVTPP